MIDSGNGSEAIPGFLSQLPGTVIKLTEQIENATGVNILSGLGQTGAVTTEPAPAAGSVGTGEQPDSAS